MCCHVEVACSTTSSTNHCHRGEQLTTGKQTLGANPADWECVGCPPHNVTPLQSEAQTHFTRDSEPLLPICASLGWLLACVSAWPGRPLRLVLIKGEPHKYAAAYKQFPGHIKVTRKLCVAFKSAKQSTGTSLAADSANSNLSQQRSLVSLTRREIPEEDRSFSKCTNLLKQAEFITCEQSDIVVCKSTFYYLFSN